MAEVCCPGCGGSLARDGVRTELVWATPLQNHLVPMPQRGVMGQWAHVARSCLGHSLLPHGIYGESSK